MTAEVASSTSVSRLEGGVIEIYTHSVASGYDGLSANISDFSGSLNGTPVNNGDLIVGNNGYDGVYVSIDSNGNLILSGSGSVNDYEIDTNGHITLV